MEVRSVKLVVETLNHAGVRYLIAGGLAVNAHGYMRATNDLDLVIALETANIVTALRVLAVIGYHPKAPITPEQFADGRVRESWVRDKGMVVLQLWSDVHPRTPVDIFVTEPFPFATEAAQASHQDVYPGVPAPFVSLKTLLAMKQAAGRDVDLLDINRLRKLHPDA
jgi:hypothetical protein